MYRSLLLALLSVGSLALATAGLAQKTADPKPKESETPAKPENIEYALKLTQAAALEYEFTAGSDEKEKEKPLELQREPILKWSNPARGEVHGNVFVWTREGRPLIVGSLFKWFSPFTHMSHEFHSFAEQPITGKFHGDQVWKTSEAGVRFVDVPKAPAPAANEAQRLLQMKQLAKDFSGTKREKEDPNLIELRLLPQPIYRYAAPKQNILSGGLFTLVHGTDPEIFVLIEARGEKADSASWQYAVTRMTGVEVHLRYQDKEVWSEDALTSKQIYSHERVYTNFMFKEIPDFLKDAVKPKP
jgi:hypothetical protein